MKFEEFIKLDIKDKNNKVIGHFVWENNQLYVVGFNKKLKFDVAYNEEYVPFYLSLAYQSLMLESISG